MMPDVFGNLAGAFAQQGLVGVVVGTWMLASVYLVYSLMKHLAKVQDDRVREQAEAARQAREDLASSLESDAAVLEALREMAQANKLTLEALRRGSHSGGGA